MRNIAFKNKKALVRVDFNVPLNKNLKVSDNTRIIASLPTIKKILAEGGAVILISHLGRPKKNHDKNYSLKPVLNVLNSHNLRLNNVLK